METNLEYIVTAAVSFITAVGGYLTGKRKQIAEADKSAYEAYNFALNSLRKEFETRIDDLQKQIQELKEQRCFVSDCKGRKK